MAKLSSGADGFDLYALLDTTDSDVTTRFKNTIRFDVDAC